MKESFELATDTLSDTALRIELDFQQRQKSRHRATTACGQALGWFLERGRVLEDGDILLCADGSKVLVIAADETVSEVKSSDAHLLMRAAYHLGNRHVPLQIGEGWLRYQHDHVLDAMLVGLGLNVDCCQRPFHPENGAYHSSEHSSGHSSDHGSGDDTEKSGHGHSHHHGHSH